ncbi:hypothetical protein EKK58_03950 [Candidatus Dependentiae bacterium]|nr:MAG: hypothetical protein EKK58_03950 [Candidatus Dependentiae bacterium]
MKKNVINLFFLFLLTNISFVIITAPSSPWILASLHYEGGIGTLPTPLYYDGNNIMPHLNKQKNHLDFEIPRSRNNQTYYIVVTEQIIPVSKKTVSQPHEFIGNTIDYLRVPKENDYRLYKICLTSEIVSNQKGHPEKIDYWEVTEMILPENGQLPPQTLIIYDLPERVLSFESGGSLISWPTMYMESVTKDTAFLHLAALDLNTIHVPFKKTYAIDKKRVIIAYSS